MPSAIGFFELGEEMHNLGFNELSDVLFEDQSDRICRIVRQNPDLARLRSEEGDTLLHLACWAKRIDAVEALLAAGADVNSRGDSGQTPLHYAVFEGDIRSVPIVQALLAQGAEPQVADSNGFTQAEWAKIQMNEGLSNVLELLAHTSAGPQSPVPCEKYGLHEAVRRGDFSAVTRILREHPALTEYLDGRGDTPLHSACRAKQLGMIGTLAAFGANFNARGDGGRTPLHLAVEEDTPLSQPMVRGLLYFGADPRIRNDSGLTPAEVARLHIDDSSPEVTKLLEEAVRVFEAGGTWQQDQLSRSIEGLADQASQVESAGGDASVLNNVIAWLRRLGPGLEKGDR